MSLYTYHNSSLGIYIILTVFGILLFTNFPKTKSIQSCLPCYNGVNMSKNKCITVFYKSVSNSFKHPYTEFVPTLKSLLGNPVYIIYLCVTIIQFNSLIGMVTYKPKYIEQHYGQSASTANFLMGKQTFWTFCNIWYISVQFIFVNEFCVKIKACLESMLLCWESDVSWMVIISVSWASFWWIFYSPSPTSLWTHCCSFHMKARFTIVLWHFEIIDAKN